MNKENRRIIFILTALCICFAVLIGYMSYFQVFKSENIKANSYNKRLWINEESILRGSIMDRNGNILAYSEEKDGTMQRYYKYGNLYSHIIGYSYREYGKSGLELAYNNQLLNINENSAIDEIINIVAPKTIGNNLELTIDHGIQERARNLLKGKKGSVVAMNPKTGEIYAMVSLPDFNVNSLREDWGTISEDNNSPLLNRATQGLYTPGSVFKVITTAAIMNTPNIETEYECSGSTTINGYNFRDYQNKAHGNLGLSEALIESCNTYFTEKSIAVGEDILRNTAADFMFNSSIPFDLPVKNSSYPKGNLGKTDLAASAIGQGKVLTTPLNMAMVASSIANNGEMVKPILVKNVVSTSGKIIKANRTETLSVAVDSLQANSIKEMMIGVVQKGTGTNASIKNVQVAGKTGTAENPSGKSHAWFIGFAPANDPKIAIAVILEEEGSTGGASAAPIARDLIIYGLNNIKF
ncbi:penicillin-binding transpeptidase domain-containing protein [Tissierella sp. Yu-01]|uniref:peptidoglycan D,D-transpeptidase FtsI family protein n=1 Tax=Tissierella sp. Yu-01 TaxID=3035694 RepID=UPI00240D63D1|nr:penicillin-binding transpeptidase domain-containing protein [Tissierella sp. Yu-01]WFA09427.1 penicillin-binding transpeptidase domain-containing protein [Tissierella sp. Yu-01]